MKVLICSDIHGILFYTKKVEELINRENVDKIVILGDVYYYGPRSIKEDTYEAGEVKDILNKYADKIIAVKGNCDSSIDDEVSNFDLTKDYDSFEVNGKKYFITHGHLMDRYMDVFGDNIVFSGHTHRYNIYGNNINPGSVGLPKVNPEHTCIILEDNIVKLIDLDNFNVIDSRIIED